MKEYDISIQNKPLPDKLLELFKQTAWANNRNLNSVEKLLGNLNKFVAVYSDEKLVGFGRAISDGVYRALIEDVVVDSEMRGKGLGKKILRALLDQLDEVEEIFLNTGKDLTEFYSDFGFKAFNGTTMVKRKRNEDSAVMIKRMTNTFVNTIVFVGDLEKSRHFYADILNIKVKQDLETIVFFENQFVLHSAGSILNTIFKEKSTFKTNGMGSKNVLLYFETTDLEGLCNSLKDNVEMIHEIERQEWGQKVFRFYDPDGHIVEFGEPENSE